MIRREQISQVAICAIAAGMILSGSQDTYGAPELEAKPNEVSITATRAKTDLKDLGISASVVTSTDIEEMGAENIADALREMTGLRVTTYGSVGSLAEISIRGSSSAQVLVLVDGRRINKTSDGSVDFSVYKPDDIERIEVLRGPASMIHGANALAGVVNIVTRRIDEKPITTLSSEFGSFNTQAYRFSTSRTFGDIGVRVSAGHSTSDGDRDNSASEGYHVIGKAEHTGDDSTSTLSAGYTTLDAGAPGSTNYPSPNATQDDERSWVDYTHQRTVMDSIEVTAKLFMNDDTLRFADPDIATSDSVKNTQYGADLQADIPVGERNNLVAGVYYEHGQVQVEDKDGISRIGGEKDLDSYAVFVQDVFRVSDDLTITPAVRLDDYYGLDTEISPKVSTRWQAADNTSIKGSIGRGFRPPTVNDLYWKDSFAVGNEDLQAEKSVSWDAGIEQACGDNVLASISYFSSEIEDLVAWEPRDSDGLWSPFNIAESEIRGLEVEIAAKLSPNLTAAIAYTWMETEDKGDFPGKELQYKPEHRASGRMSYRSENGLSVSAALAYTDSVYSDQANTQTLDSYLLLDARVAKTVGEHTVFLAGRNLLDEDYTVIKGYPMPGATVNAGIELLF